MLDSDKGVLGVRMAGVKVAREQSSERGTPQKLLGVTPVEVLLLGYTDHKGEQQASLFFYVDGQYWSTKDGEQWVSNLRPMTPWLKEQLEKYLASAEAAAKPVTVPETDAVSSII